MYKHSVIALSILALAGCGDIPTSGPSRAAIIDTNNNNSQSAVDRGIQIVDVDQSVIQQLLAQRAQHSFSETLGSVPARSQVIGAGDVLEVSIWEAPPATLFGSGGVDVHSAAATSRVTTLPDQMVDGNGMISVPFAGEILAAAKTPLQIEAEIVKRLAGNANQPQVLVRVTHNATSNVTIVGEVVNSVRMPLTPRGEHLLDALAAAGGVRQPVGKVTIQLTRGDKYYSMPLDSVIRDPAQNIPLYPGDVVTALYQPLSFNALGATGKNQEVNFETQGISLAQGLARAGGLQDDRADAQGVFIFRYENQDALKWPHQPVVTMQDGKVPVIYRFNMRDPGSFFMAQSFVLDNSDVVYVSDAPIAEMQKFLNVVFSIVYPLSNAATIKF